MTPQLPRGRNTLRVTWGAWATAESEHIHRADQWRAPREFDGIGPTGVLTATGQPVVHFASNDYLGLSQHPAVAAAAHDAIDRWGTGAGAARLIVGSRPIHTQLETELAAWKQSEAAVLFPTGFAANLGVISTFGDEHTLICSDELNHASIIDGTRLASAEVQIFPHANLHALDEIIRAHARGRRIIVVTDTVFSMDGDVADLDGLLALRSQHAALLILDEAHAVLGPEPTIAPNAAVLRVGTLSKTLGALGGFVAGPRALTDLIVNRARSYIFTTASTPPDTAAARAALSIVRSAEGNALRARLRMNIDQLREGHPSPIIPIMCGTETRAIEASEALLAWGLLVPAIRPPTVAPGTSRLRVAISAAHTLDQVRQLRASLDALQLT